MPRRGSRKRLVLAGTAHLVQIYQPLSNSSALVIAVEGMPGGGEQRALLLPKDQRKMIKFLHSVQANTKEVDD